MEILEYDTTGEQLDTTIFYIQLAQKLRAIIGNAEEDFLLSFLHDINHIVQELTNLGEDPHEVFDNVLQTGTTLKTTTGEGFYCDVQRIDISTDTTLYCFQMPGGGNIFLFEGADEQVMVDTGYGIYHADVLRMFQTMGLGDGSRITRIIITHADADHCGAGGLYGAPACMHRGTQEIIREANRAYGSASQDSVLEEVYTTMINLFSRFSPPERVHLFSPAGGAVRSIFPILATLRLWHRIRGAGEPWRPPLRSGLSLLTRYRAAFYRGQSLQLQEPDRRAAAVQFPRRLPHHLGERGQRSHPQRTKSPRGTRTGGEINDPGFGRRVYHLRRPRRRLGAGRG